MELKTRVRVIGLDVETDHPPVGIVTKLFFRLRGTPFEQELAEVTFDKNLIDEKNRQADPLVGVPSLTVETSRLELL